MGLDQPRYVVVNGWPEGSHLNEVMAHVGANRYRPKFDDRPPGMRVRVGTCEAVARMVSSRIRRS
jgi:hypothetical protein